MGVVVGSWNFTSGKPPDLAQIERQLREATGLEIERTQQNTALRIKTLREDLFEWVFAPDRISVHSFVPAHPYVWENLDAVMTAAGGQRATRLTFWQPNPLHARLRRPWHTLSARNRALLSVRSFFAARPLDHLLE